MIRLYLLFILIIINQNTLFSQNEGVLLSKYWNYRYALNGDDIDPSFRFWEPGFLELGLDAGMSLPMRYRLKFVAQNTSYPMSHSQNQYVGHRISNWSANSLPFIRRADANLYGSFPFYIPTITDRKVLGILQWHDVPTDLGKYLILLSTELELLMKDADRYGQTNGVNMNHIANKNLINQLMKSYFELYYAVCAYNRLDRISNVLYGGIETNGDGFFVRDDVPQNFADDGKFGQAQLLDQNYWTNTASPWFQGNTYLNVQSHYQDWEFDMPDISNIIPTPPFPPPNQNITVSHPKCGNAMSKDQLAKVMIGLIYAKQTSQKFESKYGSYLSSDNIGKHCTDAIDRTIWYLFPDFEIRDPDGNAVCLGSGANAYSHQFYDLYQKFSYNNFNGPAFAFAYSFGTAALGLQKAFYTAEYPLTLLTNTGFTGLNWSHEIFGYMCTMNDNATMYLIPNSLKKFGDILVNHNDKELEYTINSLLEPIRDHIYGNGFAMNIGATGFSLSLPNWMPISEYESFLNRWNFVNCEHDTRDWEGNPDTYNREEKNGLDYMIGFNLYKLKKPREDRLDMSNNEVVTYIPMYDRQVSGTFPRSRSYNCNTGTPNTWPPIVNSSTTFIHYGSKTNPITIQAANSIDASTSTYTADAKVILRAPHIVLSPGFNALFGSVCDVQENQRMTCDPYQANACGLWSKMAESKDIVKKLLETMISIYPNPTPQNATLKLENYNNSTVKIQIYNMVGKLVSREVTEEIYNNESEREVILDTESLPTGIYIVKVVQGDSYKSLKLEKH